MVELEDDDVGFAAVDARMLAQVVEQAGAESLLAFIDEPSSAGGIVLVVPAVACAEAGPTSAFVAVGTFPPDGEAGIEWLLDAARGAHLGHPVVVDQTWTRN